MRSQIQRLAIAAGIAVACTAPAVFAADNPMVGGAPMYANKTIVENASTAKNLSTLVAAVKAAGLVEPLAQPGRIPPFAQRICRGRVGIHVVESIGSGGAS